MTNQVEEHIAERKRIADEQMLHQGPLGRLRNRMGLMLADGWDRASAPFDSAVFPAIGGALYGGLRGATLGTVAWGALVLLAAPVSFVAISAATLIGGAAAVFGLYHAVSAVKAYEARKDAKTHYSDVIADKAGTAPMGATSPSRSAEEEREATAAYFAQQRTQDGRPTFVDLIRDDRRVDRHYNDIRRH